MKTIGNRWPLFVSAFCCLVTFTARASAQDVQQDEVSTK